MPPSIEDDTDDDLPDRNISKEFYAKYEPKDVLGRYVYIIGHMIWVNITTVDSKFLKKTMVTISQCFFLVGGSHDTTPQTKFYLLYVVGE